MNYSNKQLFRSFFISFSLLIALAFVGFLFVHVVIQEQSKNNKLINLSGKQRMYTVRIMLNAQIYCDNKEKSALKELQHYLSTMRSDHQFLKEHLISEQLKTIYFGQEGINHTLERFLKTTQEFIKTPNPQHLIAIKALSEPLIEQLDSAVSAFEAKNLELSNTLKERQLLIFIAIVILILLESYFIVRPLIRFIGNYTNELEETVQKRTKKYLLYANIFKNTAEGIMITDADRKIIDVNEGFSAITGYSKEKILGKTPNVLKSGSHSKRFYKAMWQDINTKGRWNGTLINRHYDGHNYHETLSIIKLLDDDNEVSNYIGVFSDITTLIQNEEEMRHLATHDTLTGLPNRYFLLERINHAIDVSERNDTHIAIIFIDLDNFKIINDSMGHQAGDQFLIEIAKRLSESVRKSDTVSRIGGDEFVILLETLPGEQALNLLIEKILETLRESFTYDNHKFSPAGSFGVAFSNHNMNCNAENLLRRADLAMYEAKASGKNQIVYYDSSLEDKAQHYLQVETRLQDALINNELNLFFQPKVDLKSRRVIGAEVLLRWEHEDQLLSPEQFIPIAEESDLIIEVDQWVCSETLAVIRSWRKQGVNETLQLSLNISARTFSNPVAMETIMTQIIESGYSASIDLEITEGVLIHNYTNALKTLEQLANYQISTSLDDFGTGYSSFSYLSKLPFNAIKIDRSFIMDLHDDYRDERQKVLIDAMISFSKRLGMRVIAEGIENEEQLQWLVAHNCDEGQGYHFSKPLKLEAFEAYITIA